MIDRETFDAIFTMIDKQYKVKCARYKEEINANAQTDFSFYLAGFTDALEWVKGSLGAYDPDLHNKV